MHETEPPPGIAELHSAFLRPNGEKQSHHKPITITATKVSSNTTAKSDYGVNIFTKLGRHVGFENNTAPWSLAGLAQAWGPEPWGKPS